MSQSKPSGRRRAHGGRHLGPTQPKQHGRRRTPAPANTSAPGWVKPSAGVFTAAALITGVLVNGAYADDPTSTPTADQPIQQAKAITANPDVSLDFSKTTVPGTAPVSGRGSVDALKAAGRVHEGPAAATGDGGSGKESGPTLALPLAQTSTVSAFGYRTNPLTGAAGEMHTGVDLSASCSTPVMAAAPGIVTEAGWSPYGGGNRIVIDHGNGLKTTYNHLALIGVSVTQKVAQGELVAGAGTTGNSTGCHLHFEVLINDTIVDPATWL